MPTICQRVLGWISFREGTRPGSLMRSEELWTRLAIRCRHTIELGSTGPWNIGDTLAPLQASEEPVSRPDGITNPVRRSGWTHSRSDGWPVTDALLGHFHPRVWRVTLATRCPSPRASPWAVWRGDLEIAFRSAIFALDLAGGRGQSTSTEYIYPAESASATKLGLCETARDGRPRKCRGNCGGVVERKQICGLTFERTV